MLQRTLNEEVSAVLKNRNWKCLYYDIPADIIESCQVILSSVLDPILQNCMYKVSKPLICISVFGIFSGHHFKKKNVGLGFSKLTKIEFSTLMEGQLSISSNWAWGFPEHCCWEQALDCLEIIFVFSLKPWFLPLNCLFFFRPPDSVLP